MKAMILAAGTGTRVLPLTRLRPKPLFPIYTTPLLGLTINQLKKAGIKDIVINTHHLNQKIDAYLQETIPSGVTITLQYEPQLLGTAGAIKNVENFWDDQPFIVINGDIIHTIDLNLAYQNHIEGGNLATLILHHYPRHNQVEIDQEGTIIGIREKRMRKTITATHRSAFTGIHIISPQLLKEITPGRYVDIISIYLKLIAREMKICGFQVEKHYWLDIGTPENYHHLHRDIYQKKVRLGGNADGLACRAETSSVGNGTILEGYVCIGKNSTVGKDCTIKNSIIWDEVEIKDHLTIEDCIIGDRVKVKQPLKNKVVVS